MSHDFYQLLGVEPDASEKEIRLAFRDMARRCHPDRFATQPEAYRQLAEARMAELNEAYSVLTDAPRRKLYDDCKRDTRYFRYTEMNSTPESPAEQAAREEDGTERRALAVERIHQKLLQLDPAVRWQETPDEYWDKLLAGRRGRTRVHVYLKVLEQLGPDHLKGIVDYSQAVLASTQASLLRSEFVYLLAGQRIERPATLERQVREHNFQNWAVPSGLAPRSCILWIDGQDGKVHMPEVEGCWPDPSQMGLRLDQVL